MKPKHEAVCSIHYFCKRHTRKTKKTKKDIEFCGITDISIISPLALLKLGSCSHGSLETVCDLMHRSRVDIALEHKRGTPMRTMYDNVYVDVKRYSRFYSIIHLDREIWLSLWIIHQVISGHYNRKRCKLLANGWYVADPQHLMLEDASRTRWSQVLPEHWHPGLCLPTIETRRKRCWNSGLQIPNSWLGWELLGVFWNTSAFWYPLLISIDYSNLWILCSSHALPLFG